MLPECVVVPPAPGGPVLHLPEAATAASRKLKRNWQRDVETVFRRVAADPDVR